MNLYNTIHEAYLGTLADVYDNPDYVAEPRGQRTREKLNYQFTILNPIAEPIVTADPTRNEVIKDYTAKEVALYNSCSNKVEDFAKASKFWEKLANPDGTVNSAYGYLIWENESQGAEYFELENEVGSEAYEKMTYRERIDRRRGKLRTPWRWAKESLIRDKDTRQAILRFSLPEHAWMGVKDFTCTLEGIFLIRNDKLHLAVNMRSNDLTLGLVYDLPWFISLMTRMQTELLETYPDLKIGSYTHYVHSLHCYERDSEKILKMLGRA